MYSDHQQTTKSRLNHRFQDASPQEFLSWALKEYENSIVLANSLSAEDTTILHICSKISTKFRVFVLDTGRLHEESLEFLEECRNYYKIPIQVYFPQAEGVEAMVQEKGLFSFYESIANRKECCSIRKVKPLQRALSGANAWITGLRRGQSDGRKEIERIEWDEANGGLWKLNPLVNWSWERVLDFVSENKAPFHPLHKKSYPSIGCQPCTRAVSGEEGIRSGRWWWESSGDKECGLHAKT